MGLGCKARETVFPVCVLGNIYPALRKLSEIAVGFRGTFFAFRSFR